MRGEDHREKKEKTTFDVFFDAPEHFDLDNPPSHPAFGKATLSHILMAQDKIFTGSSVSLSDAICSLFVFYLTCHIPKSTFQALLDLLHLLLPPNFLPTKVDQLLNIFSSVDGKLVYHEYCETCFHSFQEVTETKCPQCQTWRYKGGESEQSKKRMRAFFLELPIRHDLVELFQGILYFSKRRILHFTHSFLSFKLDDTFVAALSYRNERTPTPGHISDIQDGSVYQSLMGEGNLLSFKWNLALGLNTDGVSPFKSSTFNLWPIFWQVHDLPPHLRFRPHFTRICGLWYGKTKPHMNLFFAPLHRELKEFYGEDDGYFPSESLNEISFSLLLLCVCAT
jgi:hypothetical protein